MMRQCDGCTECCILGITGKPLGILCPEACGRCRIYDKRPTECRTFRCSWLAGLSPSRPQDLGLVIYTAMSSIGKTHVVVALTGGEMTAAMQAEIEAVGVAVAQQGREVEDLALVWTPPRFQVNATSKECLAQRPAFLSVRRDASPGIHNEIIGETRFISLGLPTRAAPASSEPEQGRSSYCAQRAA